ncbi:hypothetical protein BDZ89DRAFT_1056939 [Hymenopellis radicata]|nr:hypothetical protein BDZ89DRAFT_1056939 [Hymenopellis radicata]
MSEYWVSKKKYFCKYCDIYIADDAPSRQQHENGLRHKGNRDRFIRGLYKEGERRKKDQEEEKREMARVELAAQAAFAQDVGSGRARPSMNSVASSSSSESSKPRPQSSNPFANYSTAASLGFTDPDAERIAALAQQKRSEGVISGAWEVVETAPPIVEEPTADTALGKRPADEQEDDAREFKIRKRTLDAGLGKIYDPGVITLKPRKKEEPVDAPLTSTPNDASVEVPKWTPSKWKRPGEKGVLESDVDVNPDKWKRAGTDVETEPLEDVEGRTEVKEEVKTELPEEQVVDVKVEEASSVPPPQTAPQGSSIFRKRKPVTGGTRGKRSI